jgi:enamine deaminase RidA (YjgF/YER057c/UK114 family)
MSTEQVDVPAWPAPKGYANGRIGRGAVLHIAGQVGWTSPGVFEAKDLVGQFAQALANMRVVLEAARGKVSDIASMTVFVTDIAAYRASTKALGPVWREKMGSHFPAMALVGVSALVEREALVEIQAIAYVE